MGQKIQAHKKIGQEITARKKIEQSENDKGKTELLTKNRTRGKHKILLVQRVRERTRGVSVFILKLFAN